MWKICLNHSFYPRECVIHLALRAEGRWVARLVRGVFAWINTFKGGSHVFITSSMLTELERMNCDIDIDRGSNHDCLNFTQHCCLIYPASLYLLVFSFGNCVHHLLPRPLAYPQGYVNMDIHVLEGLFWQWDQQDYFVIVYSKGIIKQFLFTFSMNVNKICLKND